MSARLQVVAAAIVRNGRVLAARRARPAALAGRWEFPGGKIDSGESATAALRRECQEELAVRIRVGACLGSAADDQIDLWLYSATLAGGEPVAGPDHDCLCWLAADELEAVDWLPIDRRLLAVVPPALAAPPEEGAVVPNS